MQTIHAYERLTHRYRDAWRHLDQSEYRGTVRATPMRQVEEGNGLDDGGRYIMHARSQAGAPNLKRALTQTLSHSSCTHEYDCCGCQITYATVRKVSARDYVIEVSVGYNY